MKNLPPQNTEMEAITLGNMLLSSEAAAEAFSILTPEDYYKAAHQIIHKAGQDLFERGEPIDALTVQNRLQSQGKLEQIGGAAFIFSLLDLIPMPSSVKGCCRVLKELACKRKLIKLAMTLNELCHSSEELDYIVNDFGQRFLEVSGSRRQGYPKPIGAIVGRALQDIFSRAMTDGLQGLPTGLYGLDRLLGGLVKKDLVILAGRPSMGKTALAMNIARTVAEQGEPVLIFSLEMGDQSLIERILADAAGINGEALRRGIIDDSGRSRLEQAAGRLQKLPVTIDDSPGLSVTELRARAKRQAIKSGLSLVVVDYLQLMHYKGAETREREIAQISGGLKALAKELDVPVLALSQLNRSLEARSDKRPILSDLRDSGAIEQDADVVILIYRDEVYHTSPENPLRGTAELIIAKHRNGRTGSVNVRFEAEKTRFSDISS